MAYHFLSVVTGTHICIWGLYVLYKINLYINVECSILWQNLSSSTEGPGSCHIMAILDGTFSFSSYVKLSVATHPHQ
jgi:hypothetical protein